MYFALYHTGYLVKAWRQEHQPHVILLTGISQRESDPHSFDTFRTHMCTWYGSINNPNQPYERDLQSNNVAEYGMNTPMSPFQ